MKTRTADRLALKIADLIGAEVAITGRKIKSPKGNYKAATFRLAGSKILTLDTREIRAALLGDEDEILRLAEVIEGLAPREVEVAEPLDVAGIWAEIEALHTPETVTTYGSPLSTIQDLPAGYITPKECTVDTTTVTTTATDITWEASPLMEALAAAGSTWSAEIEAAMAIISQEAAA